MRVNITSSPLNVITTLFLLLSISSPLWVYGGSTVKDQIGDKSSTQEGDRSLLTYEIEGLINGSPDPCIFRNIIQAGSAECEHVMLPAGFCQTCGVNIDIKPESGKYENCLYLSGLEALDGTINRQCMSKLDEYLDMNSCDTFRRRGMDRYKLWTNRWIPFQRTMLRRLRAPSRQIMDAFIYALCELPCDCIPQYNADITTPAQDIYRGNCQGHAQIDLCAVYPNIKLIQGQNSNMSMPAASIEELPYVCPRMNEWRQNHPGAWFDLTPTIVDSDVAVFINYALDATEITHFTNTSENPLWQQCFHLESTQQRIISI